MIDMRALAILFVIPKVGRRKKICNKVNIMFVFQKIKIFIINICTLRTTTQYAIIVSCNTSCSPSVCYETLLKKLLFKLTVLLSKTSVEQRNNCTFYNIVIYENEKMFYCIVLFNVRHSIFLSDDDFTPQVIVNHCQKIIIVDNILA